MRYRKLVKRWHPDRYATDPQGQIEAAQQMSRINQAFALVAASMATSARPTRGGAAPAADRVRPPVEFGSRPLNRSEIDDIVRAIGMTNPVLASLRWLSWAVPLAAAFVAVSGHGGRLTSTPATAKELMLGGTLFLIAAGVIAYQVWTRPR